ncbi:L-alanine exporter AlaE [Rhizobium johnstonii]
MGAGLSCAVAASGSYWDSAAPMTFQVPIYTVIIVVSGAEGGGLLSGIGGATVVILVLGRPYAAILNCLRNQFGLPKGGTKPMSLNNGEKPERFSTWP